MVLAEFLDSEHKNNQNVPVIFVFVFILAILKNEPIQLKIFSRVHFKYI